MLKRLVFLSWIPWVILVVAAGSTLTTGHGSENVDSVIMANTAKEGISNKERIVPMGDMASPRADHTSTLLQNGAVLVVGGMTDKPGVVGAAEIFNPSTTQFTPAGALSENRFSHSATLLEDGQVLITGGYDKNGSYLKSAELYDPNTNRFTPISDMTTARAGHKAVRLQDGKVLIVGGVGTGWTFLSSAELFDPASGRFTATGSMQFTRESHSVVGLSDGTVLVIGGHTGRRSAMQLYDQIERYNPSSGTFKLAGKMTIPRHKQDATLLSDGTVLISGGADERDSQGVFRSTERYDPQTQLSGSAGSLLLERYKHEGNSVLLPSGSVLFAGGAEQAERLQIDSGKSVLIAGEGDLSGQFSSSVLLPGGRVLITGGYGWQTSPTSSAWLYLPGK